MRNPTKSTHDLLMQCVQTVPATCCCDESGDGLNPECEYPSDPAVRDGLATGLVPILGGRTGVVRGFGWATLPLMSSSKTPSYARSLVLPFFPNPSPAFFALVVGPRWVPVMSRSGTAPRRQGCLVQPCKASLSGVDKFIFDVMAAVPRAPAAVAEPGP